MAQSSPIRGPFLIVFPVAYQRNEHLTHECPGLGAASTMPVLCNPHLRPAGTGLLFSHFPDEDSDAEGITISPQSPASERRARV